MLCKEGKVLIQLRPERVPGGGLWEFPGGKVELGETPVEALRRELEEQTFRRRRPCRRCLICQRCAQLPCAPPSRLHAWTGAPEEREGQMIKWVDSAAQEHHEMLPLDEKLALPLHEFMMWEGGMTAGPVIRGA